MVLKVLLLFVFVSFSYCGEAWNEYMVELMSEFPQLKSLAIASTDGTIDGKSQNFLITEEELKKLSDQFNNHTEMQDQGVTLGGNRYIALSSEADVFYGINTKDKTGVIARKTTHYLIVAFYDGGDTQNRIEANKAVERIREQDED